MENRSGNLCHVNSRSGFFWKPASMTCCDGRKPFMHHFPGGGSGAAADCVVSERDLILEARNRARERDDRKPSRIQPPSKIFHGSFGYGGPRRFPGAALKLLMDNYVRFTSGLGGREAGWLLFTTTDLPSRILVRSIDVHQRTSQRLSDPPSATLDPEEPPTKPWPRL